MIGMLQILEEREFFSSIDGVRRALDGLLPTVRAASDPALRDIYVSKVAERTGVPAAKQMPRSRVSQ